NPQGTAQITVELASAGDYPISTGAIAGGGTSPGAAGSAIRPSVVHVGPDRPPSHSLLRP
ncbi:MAG: hypothetical protein JO168_12340, partial [Solirubrobacterales bacterium]|nr:hypothetical protein [Solirubrobacterales bacterium]